MAKVVSGTGMQEINCYQILVAGQVEEKEFNEHSPLWIRVERAKPASTQFTVSADQSGIIGLLRFLHLRGFVLLSVTRSGTTVV